MQSKVAKRLTAKSDRFPRLSDKKNMVILEKSAGSNTIATISICIHAILNLTQNVN
jgi:hypothetical protein